MRRRTLLRSATLLPPALLGLPGAVRAQAQPAARAAALTAQDQADLGRVEAYLNGIRTLKARFLQVAPDGRTAEGTAWLQRPGRMRFQYDPPSPLLLVAGNGLVVFHDAQLNQTSNIPLGSTPLGLLLSDTVRLNGDVTVTGLVRRTGQLQVTLVRTAEPSQGSLTLVMADPPMVLRSWAVLDPQHLETRVSLFDVQLGGQFDQSLFTFIDPRFFGAGPTTAPGQ